MGAKMSRIHIVYFSPLSDCAALGQVIRDGFCSLPQGVKKTSPATSWILGILTFNTPKRNPLFSLSNQLSFAVFCLSDLTLLPAVYSRM